MLALSRLGVIELTCSSQMCLKLRVSCQCVMYIDGVAASGSRSHRWSGPPAREQLLRSAGAPLNNQKRFILHKDIFTVFPPAVCPLHPFAKTQPAT